MEFVGLVNLAHLAAVAHAEAKYAMTPVERKDKSRVGDGKEDDWVSVIAGKKDDLVAVMSEQSNFSTSEEWDVNKKPWAEDYDEIVKQCEWGRGEFYVSVSDKASIEVNGSEI